MIGQKRSARRRSTKTSPSNPTSTILNQTMSTIYDPSIHLTLSSKAGQQVPIASPLVSGKVTIPKSPKPQRTHIIFEHVLIGLRYTEL